MYSARSMSSIRCRSDTAASVEGLMMVAFMYVHVFSMRVYIAYISDHDDKSNVAAWQHFGFGRSGQELNHVC